MLVGSSVPDTRVDCAQIWQRGALIQGRDLAKLKLISFVMTVAALSAVVPGSWPIGTGRTPGYNEDSRTAKDQSAPLSLAEAKKLKNPIPFTKKSIARGRTMFMGSCTACHGMDGKAMVDVVADATDLTSPGAWRNGTTEGEIFKSIRDGAGTGMPPFKFQIHKDNDLWDLVNYVRSLWPESMRPQLQEDPSQDKSK